MKNLELIQKMFNLFEVGDVVKGSIVTISEDGAKVKTTGGCYGLIKGKIPESLDESSAVEVEVCNIEDGLPIFAFTPNFLFERVKQKVTIRFASPHAVVVEFDDLPEVYGLYEPSAGLSAEFQKLQSGEKLLASGLKKDDQCSERYKVEKLEFQASGAQNETLPVTADKTENELLKPWPKEKIEEVFQQGSRKMYGKVKLGKIYVVTPYGTNGSEVQFADGQVGDLKEPFPKGWTRAIVRVVFITQGRRPKAELIRGEAAEEKRAVPKVGTKAQGKSGKNKFRNDEVYNNGLAQGSCYRAGGYWLGYNYKVEVKNGLPYFAPANQDLKNILERARVVVNAGSVAFKEGDIVCAEIAFIRRDGNTHDYTFEVNILKVF